MPELPDLVVHLERLRPRVESKVLKRVRLLNPFLLRSVEPPLSAVEVKPVVGLRRLGKRIGFALEPRKSRGKGRGKGLGKGTRLYLQRYVSRDASPFK